MERESEVSKVLFVSGWEVVAGPVVPLFDGRLSLKKAEQRRGGFEGSNWLQNVRAGPASD